MREVQRFRYLDDPTYRGHLEHVRQLVSAVAKHNLIPHFTDHTEAHTDKVADYAAQLIAPIQEGQQALSDDELFVLYAACYLHDVGLAYEKPYELPGMEDLIDGQRWAAFDHNEKTTFIRKHHAKMSACIVVSWESFSKIPKRNLIAALCEAHTVWLPQELERYEQLMKAGPERMRLLSGLLRVSDMLDEDSRRANETSLRWLDLPLESQIHWWRHQCVDQVQVDATSRTIKVFYQYAKSHEHRHETIKKLHFEHLELEYRRHEREFVTAGSMWHICDQVIETYYDVVEPIPDEVYEEMLRIVDASNETHRPPTTGWDPLDEEAEELQALWEQARTSAGGEAVGLYMELAARYQRAGQMWRELFALNQADNVLADNGGVEIQANIASRAGLIYSRIGSPLYALRRLHAVQSRAQAEGNTIASARLLQAEVYALLTLSEFKSALAKWHDLRALSSEMAAELLPTVSWASLLMAKPVPGLTGTPAAEAFFAAVQTGSLSQNVQTDDCWELSTLAYFADLADQLESAEELLDKARIKATTKEDLHDLQWNGYRLNTRTSSFPDAREHAELNDLNELNFREGYRARRKWSALQADIGSKTEEALSRAWHLVLESWLELDWAEFEIANGILSRQLAKIGRPDAAWHAVLSRDESWCTEIGQLVAGLDGCDWVDAFASMSMTSKLPGHFPYAAKLLEPICAQLTPAVAGEVLKFALSSSDGPFSMMKDRDIKRPAWRLLRAVGPFAPKEQLTLAAEAAMKELGSKTDELVYDEVLQTVLRLAPTLSGSDSMALVVAVQRWGQEARSHASSTAWAVIEALTNRLSETDKSTVADLLFPTDKEVHLHPMMLGALRALGRDLPKEAIVNYAALAVREMPLWLQEDLEDTEPKEPGFRGIKMSLTVNGMKITANQPDYHLLSLVAGFFDRIDPESQEAILYQAVRQAAHPKNVTANRINMLQFICSLPVAGADKHREMVIALEPSLWISNVDEGAANVYAQAQNPLNPFKIDLGDPFGVSIWAFRAIGRHASDDPRFLDYVSRGLASHDIRQRDAAIAGLGELKALAVEHAVTLAVLMMSDSEERSWLAAQAIWTHAEGVHEAARLTVASSVAELSYGSFRARMKASELAERLIQKWNGAERIILEDVKRRLSGDADGRVRRAAQRPILEA